MAESKLDRELARALSDGAGVASGQPPLRTPPPPRKRGNVGLLAILLVMGGAIVALIMTSFKDATVYAKSVDMLAAAPVEAGRRLRVEGLLVHGSLERRDQPCEYRFEMEKNGAKMKVRFPQCVVPDTFRDVAGMDVGVTVEGKLVKAGEFEATQVLAKCPSKYEMKDRAARGEQMPHVPVPNAPDPLRSEL
jgi:cytochrome c-type biogenesis protein CcmE